MAPKKKGCPVCVTFSNKNCFNLFSFVSQILWLCQERHLTENLDLWHMSIFLWSGNRACSLSNEKKKPGRAINRFLITVYGDLFIMFSLSLGIMNCAVVRALAFHHFSPCLNSRPDVIDAFYRPCSVFFSSVGLVLLIYSKLWLDFDPRPQKKNCKSCSITTVNYPP